jgi:hypothetical protein
LGRDNVGNNILFHCLQGIDGFVTNSDDEIIDLPEIRRQSFSRTDLASLSNVFQGVWDPSDLDGRADGIRIKTIRLWVSGWPGLPPQKRYHSLERVWKKHGNEPWDPCTRHGWKRQEGEREVFSIITTGGNEYGT